ncbi:MAG: hypothetical protein ACSLFK_15225 [Gemmatimonadaceae bacterium]
MQLAVLACLIYVGSLVADDVMAYYRYRDAMKQEVRFAATRSDAEMRRRLLAFTDSVKLPPSARDVNIVRDDRSIRIWTEYDAELRLPFYERTFHLRPSAEKTF